MFFEKGEVWWLQKETEVGAIFPGPQTFKYAHPTVRNRANRGRRLWQGTDLGTVEGEGEKVRKRREGKGFVKVKVRMLYGWK